MLYADAGLIVAPVSGVACYILLAHRLSYEAVGGPYSVVGADPRFGIAKPIYGICEGTLCNVEDDSVYRFGVRAVGGNVVAGARGIPTWIFLRQTRLSP